MKPTTLVRIQCILATMAWLASEYFDTVLAEVVFAFVMAALFFTVWVYVDDKKIK